MRIGTISCLAAGSVSAGTAMAVPARRPASLKLSRRVVAAVLGLLLLASTVQAQHPRTSLAFGDYQWDV
ncbi:MAG: hypothetical protein ACRERU_11715, partial [Methylococcales bacterium]